MYSKEDQILMFVNEVNNIEKQKLEYYYIIPFKWVINWDNYVCGNSNTHPGIIDVSMLLEKENKIKENLTENTDFIIVTKKLFLYLFDIYKGKKKLKTDNRHLYTTCLGDKFCKISHNLSDLLCVFKLYDDIKSKMINKNGKYNPDSASGSCLSFAFC